MTKAEWIYRQLKKRILEGRYPVSSRIPSETMLADEFSVNRKTANLAVAMLEKDGLVRRGVRGAGTRVTRQDTFSKGYLAFFADFTHYNNRILNGLQRAAHGYGYAAVVFYADDLEMFSYLDSLPSTNIRGIIASEFTQLLTRSIHMPTVLVDNGYMEDTDYCGVTTDHYQGAYDLMREILRRGHRKIAIYSGRQHNRDRIRRVNGFLDAMREAGISDAAKRVYYGGYQNVHEADSVLKKIRSTQPETTLIACDADETAAVLLQAAAMTRLRIPDDIAVTSYGNTLLSIPPLATVEQEPEKIGEIACFQLISIIENGPPEKPVREFVIPHVVYPEYIPDLTCK